MLVTTRSSGSSYLNRVELQNGCISLGHSDTFIPSTLAGSGVDPDKGNISEVKLQENLHLAMDAYMNRVDGCSCGDTSINLYKGSETEEYHSITDQLEIFLKGSNKNKEVLRKEQPELFSRFQKIWDIRNSHMVKDYLQHTFFFKCCYQDQCNHPICQSGRPPVTLCWYQNGSPVSHIPFPVSDPTKPWGNQICTTCKGVCTGHYKTIPRIGWSGAYN